jgi:hypothetical protein
MKFFSTALVQLAIIGASISAGQARIANVRLISSDSFHFIRFSHLKRHDFL